MVEIESRGQPSAQRLSSVTTVQVEFKDTVAAVIPTMPPVAATPYLVMVAEIACTNLVLDRLEPGQITVGTRVVIDHLGASKVGATLTLHIPNSSAVRQTGSNFSFASRMLSGRWRKSSMSALRSHFRKS